MLSGSVYDEGATPSVHSHFASRFGSRAPQLSSYEDLIDVTSIVKNA